MNLKSLDMFPDNHGHLIILPCDYFLSGYIKYKTDTSSTDDVEDIKERITSVIRQVATAMHGNVWKP